MSTFATFVYHLAKQVLTANLGHILGVTGAENGLDDFRSTPTLSFEQFRYYLESEIFSSLKPDEVCIQYSSKWFVRNRNNHVQISVDDQRQYEKKIDEVCWLICSPPYLERGSRTLPGLTTEIVTLDSPPFSKYLE